MTITKATWDRLLRYAEVQKRLGDALSELQEAQGGTWLDAAEVAIGAITRATYGVYRKREWELRDKLLWLPYAWRCWIVEHWPRKWLPRL